MPELPEVETIRRDLKEHLVGRKVVSVDIIFPKTAKNGAAFFVKALTGRTLKEVSRRGKLLILKFASDTYLLIHLKMTGQLIYLEKEKKIAGGHSLSAKKQGDLATAVGGELPNKHTRAVFDFQGGGRLFFNDLRKFGYLKIVDQKEMERVVAENYGPEPLEKELDAAYIKRICAGKKTRIKSLLLDQKLIAGLGNIYVDEALFAAGVLPGRQAGTLTSEEAVKLAKVIKVIIKKAIEYRGTTFSDYRDSKGNKGNFSRLLQVYGRGKEKCLQCGGAIKKEKIGGRGSHYCSNCQK